MIRAAPTAALGLLFASSCASAAEATSPNWYVGGAFGALHLDTDYEGQVRGATIATDGGAIHDVRARLQDKQGGRAFAGWRLTPRFSFELDYVNLGRISQDYTIPGQPLTIFFGNQTLTLGQDQFLREGRSRVDGYGLSAVACWPLAGSWSLMGRAGVARTRLRYEEAGTFLHATADGTTNPPTARISAIASPRAAYADVNQTRPVLALGVDYALSPRLDVRGEWARYFGVGRNFERDIASVSSSKGRFDIDLVSIGAALSF